MPGLLLLRLIALLTPALLLAGAYVSQYWGGLYPCEMCWWQRYAHMAALVFALLGFVTARNRPVSNGLIGLAAVAIAVSGVIGLFHAGVEYGWWEGLTACSTTAGASGDLAADIWAAPIVRCDVAPWTLAGISLAGYNGLLSLAAALAIFWLLTRYRNAP